MLNYLLGLDKVIFKLVLKKCADFGAIFYLGPFEGAVIYGLVILLAILKVQAARNKGAKTK